MSKQPIDPDIPRDVYSAQELGKVISAQRLENVGIIQNAPRTIYVVNHYAPAQLVRYENWGDHLRIYINNYILGIINNIGLCLAANPLLGEADPPPLEVTVRAIGEKFLAERLLLHSQSEIGRTLFVESVMLVDPPLRRVLMGKESNTELAAASDALNHICSDFITFHELGHVGNADKRYAPFAADTIASLDQMAHFDFWKGDERSRVIEEVFSDIFAINTLFARHAPTWTARSLVDYTSVVVTTLSNLLILDLLKDDLIRANVDPDHPTDHIEAGILELTHRRQAMLGYLKNFDFGPDTVVPVKEDQLPEMPQPNEVLDAVFDAVGMIEPFDEHTRRIASLVSLGFHSPDGFNAIVDACRTGYEFPYDHVAALSWKLTRIAL